jgi:hypothetical protein
MILRRLGGGDEAYVIYAIMAQITGKENICFLLCPLRLALPYLNTLRMPTTTPTKIAFKFRNGIILLDDCIGLIIYNASPFKINHLSQQGERHEHPSICTY